MSKLKIIVNPSSGREKSTHYKNLMYEQWHGFFDEISYSETEKAHDATRLARQAAEEKVDYIVTLGGDGTVHEAVNGIADCAHRPIILPLPGGTVNSLARSLKIPTDLETAIRETDFSRHIPVDLGIANGRYFVLNYSLGALPEAIHDVPSSVKTKIGAMAYAKSLFENLSNMPIMPLSIEADGEKLDGAYTNVFVSLSGELAGLTFEPDSTVNDGRMNMILVKPLSLPMAIDFMLKTIGGQFKKSDALIYRRVRSIQISTDTPVDCDMDGDRIGKLPSDIRIMPSHVDMICGQK